MSANPFPNFGVGRLPNDLTCLRLLAWIQDDQSLSVDVVERYNTILRLREEGKTYPAIAAALDLSLERVRQLHAAAARLVNAVRQSELLTSACIAAGRSASELPVRCLLLNPRASNALRSNFFVEPDRSIVDSFRGLTSQQLLNAPGFGRASLGVLHRAMLVLRVDGQYQTLFDGAAAEPSKATARRARMRP